MHLSQGPLSGTAASHAIFVSVTSLRPKYLARTIYKRRGSLGLTVGEGPCIDSNYCSGPHVRQHILREGTGKGLVLAPGSLEAEGGSRERAARRTHPPRAHTQDTSASSHAHHIQTGTTTRLQPSPSDISLLNDPSLTEALGDTSHPNQNAW